MTPTSPTTTTSTSRPPARNKSSSALSTQTIRSLSSTTSGGSGGPPKPRRNKSSSSLAHGTHHHSAGHHPVSFAHTRRNSSHGHAGPPHGLKRSGSVTGSQRKGAGAGFGLGMTSMTSLPPADGAHRDEDHGEQEDDRPRRPKLEGRRSSSSSTATVVASDRERGRDRSRSRARHEEAEAEAERRRRDEESRRQAEQAQQQEEGEDVETPVKPKMQQRVSGSVTSTNSEWASETDSPLAIGKKLPPVDRALQPSEGKGGLAQAFDHGIGANGDGGEEPPAPSRANGGKKATFQLGTSEDQEDEEEEEDEVDEAAEGEIPPAAMPPSETPALPAMPAVIQAITPVASMSNVPDADGKAAPENTAEDAASALPPPITSAQHLSPPDSNPEPEPRGPAGNEGSPGEPTLAAADQPGFAFADKQPALSSSPGADSKIPAISPNAPPQKAPPASRLNPATAQDPPSPIRPHPQRMTPARKSSDASIMSRVSMRSHLTAKTHRAPQFRRTASGAAPVMVDRAAMARAEMASPIPDGPEAKRGEAQRSSAGSERERDRPGSSRAGGSNSHSRTESMSSLRSLKQAAEATTASNRRANTVGSGDAKRLKASETAGGALAALGSIQAMSNARSPAPSTGRSGEGSEDEGALTHAKRSASGYFNALRGIAGLQSMGSTPPLSPSANALQRYPIPGANSRERSTSSYARGARARSSPSPINPPLIVKFAEPPPPPPQPAPRPSPPPSSAALSSSPPKSSRLTAQSRTASSTSLSHGPLSRTQQKALLARDAPSSSPSISHNPSGTASPAPAGGAAGQPGATTQNGMQKWAFGLIKEAERIERQYRAVERWRDPMGESLERVLRKLEAEKRAGRNKRIAPEAIGEATDGAGGEVSLVVPGQQQHGLAARGKQRAVTLA
ncbi:hypothetical protein JCM11251_006316 [Rhodosporidiobolus azoricus]